MAATTKTTKKNAKRSAKASATKATKNRTPTSAETQIAPATAETAKRMSALDAAAKVLAESGQPMNTKAMIDAMAANGYWTSPGGKTPQATLYAAILREIQVKKADSRFHKASKGHFAIYSAS